MRGITLLTDKAKDAASLIASFIYRTCERAGQTLRMVSDPDIVDVREVSGFVRSVPGAGVPDHLGRDRRLTSAQIGSDQLGWEAAFRGLVTRRSAPIRRAISQRRGEFVTASVSEAARRLGYTPLILMPSAAIGRCRGATARSFRPRVHRKPPAMCRRRALPCSGSGERTMNGASAGSLGRKPRYSAAAKAFTRLGPIKSIFNIRIECICRIN